MTVARPPTMPNASWVIEWKWWNEKIPFRQSGSQPFEPSSSSHALASRAASTPW
jgi:hypothetical protein